MGKGIGFNQNIRLAWMEAVAEHRARGDSLQETRERLDEILTGTLRSALQRRKCIGILVTIWFHNEKRFPDLYKEALGRFGWPSSKQEHIWLHYGLTLLAYPYFREVAHIAGRLAYRGEVISIANVRKQVLAARGNLAAAGDCVSRVLYALWDWGLLERSSGRRDEYIARVGALATEDISLQTWLLTCALQAHPADALPLWDLLRLPEVFPFRFTVGSDALRHSAYLSVERQGGSWDAVRLKDRA